MTPAELLAVASGGAAAAAALGTLVLRAERRGRRLANRLLGDGVTPGALDRLDDVWAQVHPNSGSSLRDAVDRVERGLAEHVAAPRDLAHPRR